MADAWGQTKLSRKLTAQLRFPNEPTFSVAAQILVEHFGRASFRCLQPHGSGRYQVTFSCAEHLQHACTTGVKFKDEILELTPLETPSKWITVRNAPYELPDHVISSALLPFGKVISIEHEIYEEYGFSNGNRKVKFLMQKAIPNFVRVGVYTLMITYSGVNKLCRRCFKEGHMVADCPELICAYCKVTGLHFTNDCPKIAVKNERAKQDELLAQRSNEAEGNSVLSFAEIVRNQKPDLSDQETVTASSVASDDSSMDNESQGDIDVSMETTMKDKIGTRKVTKLTAMARLRKNVAPKKSTSVGSTRVIHPPTTSDIKVERGKMTSLSPNRSRVTKRTLSDGKNSKGKQAKEDSTIADEKMSSEDDISYTST